MPDREELYRRFADRFHAGKRIRPATEAQIGAAEAAMGVLYPESYRRFALTCGALSTGKPLEIIGARRPGYSDVQEFLTPRQSVTESRRPGFDPAAGSLVLAVDCSGNLFTFRGLSGSPPRPDDATVWLFDHEYDETTVEAPSFDAWIARFLEL